MRPLLYASFLFLFLAGAVFTAGCTTDSKDKLPATTAPAAPMASAQVYPDITGTWVSDDATGYNLNTTVRPVTIGTNTWIFTAQDGQVAQGYKVFHQPDGTFANQTMIGVLDPDGRSVIILDQPGGWAKGTLIGRDTMYLVLTYTGKTDTDGNSFVMTMTFNRQK